MMSETTVLEQYVTPDGFYMVHWVRVGAQVPSEVIWRAIPEQMHGSLRVERWQEGERIVRYHARARCWARLAVSVQAIQGFEGEATPAVVWRVGPGERMRTAFQDAADTFWGHHDRHPVVGYARRLPRNAPREMVLEGVALGEVTLPLAEAAWVPQGCVVVVGKRL